MRGQAFELALEADWAYRKSFVLGQHHLGHEDDDTIEHYVLLAVGTQSPETIQQAINIITNEEYDQ